MRRVTEKRDLIHKQRLPQGPDRASSPLDGHKPLALFGAFIPLHETRTHMAASESGPTDADSGYDVVSSVDGEGSSKEYVIADITADGAWLAMEADDAPDLPDWR